MSTVARSGYEFSTSTGKFEKTSLNYEEPDRSEAYAYGEYTSIYAARVLIKNYYDGLVSDLGTDAANSENIAFTFGKDALLAILAQEDCVGIKFYIGKRTSADCPTNYSGTWAGKTLVAIGIKNDSGKTEIGADTDYIARGIDGTLTSPSYATQPGIVMEICPTFKMNDLQ